MTGPQLRIIRECAGISQLALGKMLGISQTWVSRFERGLSLIPERKRGCARSPRHLSTSRK